MSIRVHLKRSTKSKEVETAGLKRFTRSVLAGEGVEDGGLTVVLADDEIMRGINHRYRGQDRTTDVLAFPLGENDEDGDYIGDVIVSLDRAREQAPRFDNDPETELARLLAHGVLHLLGYDHHTPSDGKKMKQAERRALARFEPGSLWPEAGPSRA